MGALTQLIAWLNAAANVVGDVVLAPIGMVPRWLSLIVVSVITGIIMILVFKYTSNQNSIKRVRADIRANLYALKLFKESALVALRAQGRMLTGAFWLLIYSIVPMLVMVVPVLLILSQLGLWYQRRPIRVNDRASVIVQLRDSADHSWPEVRLEPTTAVNVITGPVHMGNNRAVCWEVEAREPGYHRLQFQVGGQVYDKELAVGDSTMRVSELRPGWNATDILMHPHEKPFAEDSLVQSIEIKHSVRTPRTGESSLWIVWWFLISMVAGFCLKGVFKVHI